MKTKPDEKISERVGALFSSGKKGGAIIVAAGVVGLCLILVSSIGKGNARDAKNEQVPVKKSEAEEVDFCTEAEEKITAFLRNVEGVGEVKVLVTLGKSKEYIYATEGKGVRADNKTEEANNYVMVGNSSNKSALELAVKPPQISGVVIACTGSGSPAVQESVYRTVSTAFGIPISHIYVTQLSVK